MGRKHLKVKLHKLVEKLEKEDWPLERINKLPIHWEVSDEEGFLQAEMGFLEYEGDLAHIVVSLDDGKFFNSIFPVSLGFFVKPQS